ncbi:MAG: hypothetical protein JSS55_16990 [Proteobacteria bacterium]|nr:hypothetical protein [Pseudomonadota bacterium]
MERNRVLEELRRLHAQILQNLDVMDGLVGAPAPEPSQLAATRYALTRASRARTILIERAYPALLQHASPAQRAVIERLREDGKAGLARSAQHIGSWTMQEVIAKWADYCAASDALRTEMRRRVSAEADCLYPLLADMAGSSMP